MATVERLIETGGRCKSRVIADGQPAYLRAQKTECSFVTGERYAAGRCVGCRKLRPVLAAIRGAIDVGIFAASLLLRIGQQQPAVIGVAKRNPAGDKRAIREIERNGSFLPGLAAVGSAID